MNTTIYIASDHAGYTLKEYLIHNFSDAGIILHDLGTNTKASCDYPVFAQELSAKVVESNAKGILICGTGIGMSIAANRVKGIRAAVCAHEFHAVACREHNDANVLCLGERITAPWLAFMMARLFLSTPFSEGRHKDRLNLIDPL